MDKNVLKCIFGVLEAIGWGILGAIVFWIIISNINIGIKIILITLLALCFILGKIAICIAQIKKEKIDRIERNSKYIPTASAQMGGKANRNDSSLNGKTIALDQQEILQTQTETTGKKATKIVLLNEQGGTLLEWSLVNKTSLIIGKNTERESVDIDLSCSAIADMISKQHAVLNYTNNGWYIDDIDSKNGTRVKKKRQSALLDVKLVGTVELEVGDIIYIANAMLQIK